MNLTSLRQLSLTLAESIDSWRVIPRIMLIAYGMLVVNLYTWFIHIPTYIQQKCDPAVLQIFITAGKTIADAQALACTIVDVVGGPTAAQSAFVTTVIGLSTGIFGLYTATGRRWEGYNPTDPRNRKVYPIQPSYRPIYPVQPVMPYGGETPQDSNTESNEKSPLQGK